MLLSRVPGDPKDNIMSVDTNEDNQRVNLIDSMDYFSQVQRFHM